MAKARLTYDVHPGVEWTRRWIEKLQAKTGRSEAQWRALVKKEGPKDPKECRAWLMKEHGLSTMNAWYFASSDGAMSWGTSPEAYLKAAPGYVDAMYAGKKAALRPILDALVKAGRALGDDVKIAPCQTMVPFYRQYVFAEVHPTTQTRVDLFLALGRTPAKGRLKVSTRRTDDRCTHVIGLASPADVDAEVKRWLAAAYGKGNETKEKPKKAAKVPADLATALKGTAKATWEALTPRMQAEWIHWIEDAKQAETRARRIDRARERLGKGQKGIY